MKTIDLAALRAALASSGAAMLLEALPERYFREGHLPGAVHFPHDNVAARAAAVLPDRRARIVVYCASDTCKNSHQAAEELVRLGYEDVAVFVGGKKEWLAAGLPLETEVR
ncbi:Rhodanese-like domain protein [Labilithrix luteola]|uniref:Rhodanese-like domain protein n=1 Tax=Labilithrix luteola TaxID=1391654 RepID=A0A0K1Q8Y5_9BACT|nr:rhodanese-like domain-containing protein [Labilithrix luteola]AKV02198.1 Rhodanese-like domain protein [Labilithrix luteola]